MSALYLNHFGLEKPPFQITPDIDFFFSGSHRGDILTALLHVASHEEGIVTAVAEVGSGKTLLARLMLSRLPDNISTVYLANPCFSRDEIISAIARDLGLTELPVSIEGKLASLHQELLRRHGLGERVLLVIDEAHTMPIESLEEVRLLSNLETSNHKLVNIMLFGQPELDELLRDRRLRQVQDRVIHRFELPPLPHDEGTAYIDHRLRTAGWHGGKLFASPAIDLLLKASGGRARRINLLADKCLLAAYAEGKQQVDIHHVKSALRELQVDPVAAASANLPWRQVLPISLGLAVIMTGVALWILKPARPDPPTHSISNSSTAAPTTQTPAVTTTTLAAPTTTTLSPATPAAKAPTDKAAAALARTTEKLRQPNLHGYTLQLAALPSESSLTNYLGFIEQHIEEPLLFAHNRQYKGKNYVAIYLGQYETEREARDTLNKLPKQLKANQPILRTWQGILQEAK
ncbi:MAG: sporulation protein [Proteobacteria bacterium]|nr:sporulation protein [Pseudomonadota bacterium]